MRTALGETAKFIHVDNDLVDEFIKENFGNLRADKEVLARRTPTDPDLRLLIPQLIASYALREGYSVIATAAHPRQAIRQKYLEIAQKSHAKAILLMFRIDETRAMQRIREAGRDPAPLDTSPHGGATFRELFVKQQSILEEPTKEELQSYFQVFEITSGDVDDVLRTIVELISLNRSGISDG